MHENSAKVSGRNLEGCAHCGPVTYTVASGLIGAHTSINMPEFNFFHDADMKLIGYGPPISSEQIKSILKCDFPGRDKFDEFYIQHNGGHFPEPAFFYRDTFYPTSSSEWNKMYVEGFYFIPLFPGQKNRRLSSSVSVREQREKYSTFVSYRSMIRDFIENHFPFSYDAADNDFWIELKSGRVRYVAWDSSETVQDVCDMAPSFYDFTSNIWLKPRD